MVGLQHWERCQFLVQVGGLDKNPVVPVLAGFHSVCVSIGTTEWKVEIGQQTWDIFSYILVGVAAANHNLHVYVGGDCLTYGYGYQGFLEPAVWKLNKK